MSKQDEDYSVPILNLPSKEADHPPNLLQHPFRALFLGCSGSGKTFTLVGMLAKWYHQYFDRIYLFSPTAREDNTAEANPWPLLKLNPDRIIDDYDEARLREIVEDQRTSGCTEGKMPRTLIIFDDMAGHIKGRTNTFINEYIIRARHDNVSIVLTSQKLTFMPTAVRANLSDVFVWPFSNNKEKACLFSEIGDHKNIEEVYEYAIRPNPPPPNGGPNPKCFLHINCRKNKFYRNLDEEIIDDEDST
jgi:hypothetical protein